MYKITNITKLRDYQFRLYHKKIPTNKELKKWKIVNSSVCNFCNEEDNIEHFLFECQVIKTLWSDWKKEIENQFQIKATINLTRIVLNDFVPRTNSIVNLLGLVMKQCVYRCRCQNNMPNIYGYNNEVEFIEETEFFYAKNTNKIAYHDKNGINKVK